MRRVLFILLILMSAMSLMAAEYTDSQTKVSYIYEPGQRTAIVKPGRVELISKPGEDLFLDIEAGNPEAKGEFSILSNFKVEGLEYEVTAVGDYAFYGCREITWVSLPSSLTTIGEHAFEKCSSLSGVGLMSGITTIGESAFESCSSLRSISLPNTLTCIPNTAFASCINLQEVELPETLTTIGVCGFFQCQSLSAISLPKGLISIGASAFEGTKLESVVIPPSVATIETAAFNISTLTLVTSLIEDPFTMNGFGAGNVNLSVYEKARLYVPKGCKEKYEVISNWNLFREIVETASTAIALSRMEFSSAQFPVYNLQGQQLKEAPKKGLYIQNGRKYVAK